MLQIQTFFLESFSFVENVSPSHSCVGDDDGVELAVIMAAVTQTKSIMTLANVSLTIYLFDFLHNILLFDMHIF